jgi:esterase/lipase
MPGHIMDLILHAFIMLVKATAFNLTHMAMLATFRVKLKAMKNSKTILFLHGALGSSQDLKPLMEYFNNKGFDLLTFEFSGHGKGTLWPQEFRIDLFARDLEDYIKKHSLTDLTVFGYSMGGYVALYHMANFEDSPISSIFTYGTKFNWSSSSVSKELPLLNSEHLIEKFPEFVEKLAVKHGDRWKLLVHSTAHMIQNLEKLDGLTREDVEDIMIPVTLMLGDQDRMVTSEETNSTSEWLKHSEVRTISHSKHELERSNLKEISQIILEKLLLN